MNLNTSSVASCTSCCLQLLKQTGAQASMHCHQSTSQTKYAREPKDQGLLTTLYQIQTWSTSKAFKKTSGHTQATSSATAEEMVYQRVLQLRRYQTSATIQGDCCKSTGSRRDRAQYQQCIMQLPLKLTPHPLTANTNPARPYSSSTRHHQHTATAHGCSESM
jgi:hypothetical protein